MVLPQGSSPYFHERVVPRANIIPGGKNTPEVYSSLGVHYLHVRRMTKYHHFDLMREDKDETFKIVSTDGSCNHVNEFISSHTG